MPKETSQPHYDTLGYLLNKIDGSNGLACKQIVTDYKELFITASGASHNHQAWPGGYEDHITEAMNIGVTLFDTLNSARALPFTKSDVLLVLFLHDLEKPFRYSYDKDRNLLIAPGLSEKVAKSAKRNEIITKYGIVLDVQHINAMKYVEGIRDEDYTPGARTMGELASLCHCADTLSARLWYNHPLSEGKDTWQGSNRINPKAKDYVLPSELL